MSPSGKIRFHGTRTWHHAIFAGMIEDPALANKVIATLEAQLAKEEIRQKETIKDNLRKVIEDALNNLRCQLPVTDSAALNRGVKCPQRALQSAIIAGRIVVRDCGSDESLYSEPRLKMISPRITLKFYLKLAMQKKHTSLKSKEQRRTMLE